MPAVTIKNINKALNDANLPLEIVKGDGYFWFAATENAPAGVEDNVGSIYSNYLRGMSIEDYVEHVKDSQ
jgi:hypothetical protein